MTNIYLRIGKDLELDPEIEVFLPKNNSNIEILIQLLKSLKKQVIIPDSGVSPVTKLAEDLEKLRKKEQKPPEHFIEGIELDDESKAIRAKIDWDKRFSKTIQYFKENKCGITIAYLEANNKHIDTGVRKKLNEWCIKKGIDIWSYPWMKKYKNVGKKKKKPIESVKLSKTFNPRKVDHEKRFQDVKEYIDDPPGTKVPFAFKRTTGLATFDGNFYTWFRKWLEKKGHNTDKYMRTYSERKRKQKHYKCIYCNSEKIHLDGFQKSAQGNVQKYECIACGRKFSDKTYPNRGLEADTKKVEKWHDIPEEFPEKNCLFCGEKFKSKSEYCEKHEGYEEVNG